jgi:hypothetical protein
MLFYGYFLVVFINLDDFFKKCAYKTSKKYKFIGTSGHRAGRQAIEPDDRRINVRQPKNKPSSQTPSSRTISSLKNNTSRTQTFNTFVKNLLNN